MAPYSNSANQLIGHHGEASFSLLAHTPGYNAEYIQYGVWEYMANLNNQVIQMQSWNTNNAGNELNMFEFPLYDDKWSTHSLYFTVVLDGYRPLNPVAHYELDEIRRLQKELKRVTDERDLLKKAAANFASHPVIPHY